MSGQENDNSTNEPKASDMEIIQVLREAKNQDEVPALMTSQINEIGDFDYSSTGLNIRLSQLNDEELVGHQKAAGRNIWWLPSEGTTKKVELSIFEDYIDYSSLDPERFSTEKAKEIANSRVPDYGDDNWWQRLYKLGSNLFHAGIFLFAISFALLIVDPVATTNRLLGYGILLGLTFIGVSGIYLLIGRGGQAVARREKISGEPFGGENMLMYLRKEAITLLGSNR